MSDTEFVEHAILSVPSNLLRSPTMPTLIEDLREKKSVFQIEGKAHSKMERNYRFIYYFLGCIHVITSVIVSCMTGAKSLNDLTSSFMFSVFLLSMVASVLSAILNFIGIEEKIAKHHATANQYQDLYKDISTFLLTSKNRAEYIHEEKIVLEKSKFIAGYSPPISSCCIT